VLRRLSITLAGLALLGAAVVIGPSPARLAAAIGCTLAAVATLALVRAPHAAVALTLALALGTQLAVPALDVPLVAWIAVAELARARSPARSLWGLAGLLGLAFVSRDAVFAATLAVAVWWAAEARRRRAVGRERAAAQARSRTRAEIARELHDVIAHTLSVIVVQATVAGEVFERRPDAARAAVAAAEDAARGALAELRRLLDVISHEASGAPQPGLGDLDELARTIERAGVAVSLRRGPESEQIPAGVGTSLYRIAQEALTNVLRHAGARSATVTLELRASRAVLTVEDDGAGSAGAPGRGLTGMRERAELLGGTFAAGAGADGGFRVRAEVPVT
jgi:signal transduction histidine kinase